jgi:hypothetical protein
MHPPISTSVTCSAFGNDDIKAAPGSPLASHGLIRNTITGKATEAISIVNRNTSHNQRVRGYNDFVPRNDRGLEPTVHNAEGIFSLDAFAHLNIISPRLRERRYQSSA